jgi:uncharacterized protein
LIAKALRLDEQGVLDDGDLLGRVLDTFVAAQLRPELAISATRPRLHHLRTEQGRHEIDLIAELAGQRVVGIEVKAGATVGREDIRWLERFRTLAGDRFVAGLVLCTARQTTPLGDRIWAVPIDTLWR